MDIRKLHTDGHNALMRTIDEMTGDVANLPNVCGHWSVRQIVAHLASFERLLGDVIVAVKTGEISGCIKQFATDADTFNDLEVGSLNRMRLEEVVEMYGESYRRTAAALADMSDAELYRTGTLPWYDDTSSLADFIVVKNYTHKREHIAQVEVFLAQKVVLHGGNTTPTDYSDEVSDWLLLY